MDFLEKPSLRGSDERAAHDSSPRVPTAIPPGPAVPGPAPRRCVRDHGDLAVDGEMYFKRYPNVKNICV